MIPDFQRRPIEQPAPRACAGITPTTWLVVTLVSAVLWAVLIIGGSILLAVTP